MRTFPRASSICLLAVPLLLEPLPAADGDGAGLFPDRAVRIAWPDGLSRMLLAASAADFDGDGRIDVAASLVDGFLNLGSVMMKTSVALRYTRQVITPYRGDIELIVGSQRLVNLLLP